MDHARKIGRQDQRSAFFRKMISRKKECTVGKICTLQRNTEKLEEDRRLVNWKRWLADRKQRQCHLSESLKREPLDLAINAHELVRSKNETRNLIAAAENSQITNQDRYRGDPLFWQIEEKLVKCRIDEKEANLFLSKDRCQRTLPPDLTRVALPEYIKKEKALVETCLNKASINLNRKWEAGDYLQRRKAELKQDIHFLEPKAPRTNYLLVVGKHFQSGDKKCFQKFPVISISQDETKRKLLNADKRIVLMIQNREFVLEKGRHFERLTRQETEELRKTKEDKNERKYAYSPLESDRVYRIFPKKMDPIIWTLTFRSTDEELCERHLNIENKGISIVTVDWRDITPTNTGIPMPEKYDRHFCFNKNPMTILPGQKATISIWFHATKPTVACETWQMITLPKIYPGNLEIRLWGMAIGKNYVGRHILGYQKLKKEISHRVRDSTVREVLEEMFQISTSEVVQETIPYDMFFLELDIFEARNPTYHYDSLLVKELKEMYKTCITKDDKIECRNWNLSLVDLRSKLLSTMCTNKWDDEEDLKDQKKKLLCPTVPKDPNDRKPSKISYESKASTDSREQRLTQMNKLNRFREICLLLLRPKEYQRSVCSKWHLAYWLLCDFVNRFEDEDDYVVTKCCKIEIFECHEDVEIRKVIDKEPIEYCEGEEGVEPSSRNQALILEVMYVRTACALNCTVGKIVDALETPRYFNKKED